MGRKKSRHPEELLTHHIQAKVSGQTYDRLKKLKDQSNCHSIGEIARMILSKERVLCFYQDKTMDAALEELSLVRKELNAIGVNINQITHHFHLADTDKQKMFHTLKVADQFKKVGDKVDQLLEVISHLAKKWLQK